jgi:hypothetical protein
MKTIIEIQKNNGVVQLKRLTEKILKKWGTRITATMNKCVESNPDLFLSQFMAAYRGWQQIGILRNAKFLFIDIQIS